MTVLWRGDYLIGNVELDGQHQALFDMANELLNVQDKSLLVRQTINLYRQVRAHFQHEETLMRKHQFPGLTSHAESHQQLMAQLHRFNGSITRQSVNHEALQAFLTDWAINHIRTFDARLGTFLFFHAGPALPVKQDPSVPEPIEVFDCFVDSEAETMV